MCSVTTSADGDGYFNNTLAAPALALSASAASGASRPNEGFLKRVLANPPTAGIDHQASWPTFGNAASSTTIVNQLGKGAFVAGAATAGAVAGTWNYMLRIPLVAIHPIFNELDLMENPQIRMHFRMNQGYSRIAVAATNKTMSLTESVCSTGSTCPVMLCSAATSNPMNSVVGTAATELTLAWGVITNTLEPTVDASYLSFTTVRLYTSFYQIENPTALVSKPMKTVRYSDVYAQWFEDRAGTGVRSTQFNTQFDFQLSASLKNVKYVAVIPFANPAGNFASATVPQHQFPFDSAPFTCQPGACIRNFNVRIGSTNIFHQNIDYDFVSFIDEFSKLSAIDGDLTEELSNGLIDFQKWSTMNRVLVADCSRITERDVPQSIQILGTNASCQGLNLLVLVVAEQQLSYNRLTGEVEDFTTI